VAETADTVVTASRHQLLESVRRQQPRRIRCLLPEYLTASVRPHSAAVDLVAAMEASATANRGRDPVD
jgi:hypothetical protein